MQVASKSFFQSVLLALAGGFLFLLVAVPSFKNYRDDLKFDKFLDNIGEIPLKAVILSPVLKGYDEHNQPYSVYADTAVPVNIEKRIIEFDKVKAELHDNKGVMVLHSEKAKFTAGGHKLILQDKVNIVRSDGSRANFNTVMIDTQTKTMVSSNNIQAVHSAGQIQSGAIEGRLTDKIVKFTGGVKMTLQPTKKM